MSTLKWLQKNSGEFKIGVPVVINTVMIFQILYYIKITQIIFLKTMKLINVFHLLQIKKVAV